MALATDRKLIIHPFVIFIIAWLLWYVIFIVSPFTTDINYYLKHKALNYYILNLFCFLIGILVALMIYKPNLKTKHNATGFVFEQNKIALYSVLIFCLVVDVAQTIDFASKTSAATTLAEVRMEFRSKDSIYPRSMVITLWALFKLSIFPIFMVLAAGHKSVKTKEKLVYYLSWAVALYALSNVLVFGKRAFMIMTLGIYIFYFIYFRLWREPGILRNGILLLLLLFVASYITFNARYGEKEFGLVDSIQADYSYAGTVMPNGKILDRIERNINKGNSLTANVQIALVNFAQYYTHGVFEFFHLYDYNYGKPRSNGAYSLSTPYKLLAIMGFIPHTYHDLDPAFSGDIDHKPWIFDSFLGTYLKDWGRNAIYAMLIYGFVFGMAYRLAQKSINWFPLYAVISTFVFFMPVTDMILNVQGYQYMGFAVIFYLFMELNKPSTHKSIGKHKAKKLKRIT